MGHIRTYLGEGTIVPEIALVGEAVAHKPKLALLDVLFLDGCQPERKEMGLRPTHDRIQQLLFRDFQLAVSPSRDFHDHVQDGLGLVCV